MVQRNRSPRYRAARAAGIGVLFACALALPAGAHRAAAQGALGISPTDVDFGVIGAGGVSVSEITITNGADEARSVDVSVVGDAVNRAKTRSSDSKLSTIANSPSKSSRLA